MTLDEAKEVLRTFSFDPDGLDGTPTRVLDIMPAAHPGLFNALRSIVLPGADPGLLTEREMEAIRVYVGQWSEEEADALVAAALAEEARRLIEEAAHVE